MRHFDQREKSPLLARELTEIFTGFLLVTLVEMTELRYTPRRKKLLLVALLAMTETPGGRMFQRHCRPAGWRAPQPSEGANCSSAASFRPAGCGVRRPGSFVHAINPVVKPKKFMGKFFCLLDIKAASSFTL